MKILGLYKNAQVFKIALAIAIVVVCYIASVFYSQMKKLDATVELISNSNQTQLELEKLLSVISNYDTSLRSYIITKNDTYIQDRFLSRGKIEESITKLKQLTASNAHRNNDIDRLKTLIDLRFKLFRRTLLLAQSRKTDAVTLNKILLESSTVSEHMKTFVTKIIFSESTKTQIENSNHQFELRDSIITAFLLVILSLLILLLSFQKMNVDIDELKKANDQLKLLNESYNTAEITAGFGHWMLNVKTNTYSFSDNYFKLMGVEPGAFEPNVENTYKYIHPDDLDYVTQGHLDSLISQQSTSIIFRYVTAEGSFKYIMGVGSFTTNGSDELIKIGVNYDITSQYKKTLELEENNKELKYSNAELEAFNNIVSHDLQEPLRKIQMFISRFKEDELNLLSLQSKDYFAKIRLTANRMQTLLMDLLDYSRTIKGDKVFVTTNLNQVLDETIQDLSSVIEEKNADIQVENLPDIKAIPFQMKQLFINLISNSLKYCDDNTIPHIKIASCKITEKEILEFKIANKKDYCKIVVSDNGIGFKQEYSDKIFLLFKRLETNPKYSGSGLGLAICSRIMENHRGYIKVKAKPNEGAKFCLFIPKGNLF